MSTAKLTMYQLDWCVCLGRNDIPDYVDFACRICKIKFKTKETAKNHLLLIHEAKGIHEFMKKEGGSLVMKDAQKNKMMLDLRRNYDAETTDKMVKEYDQVGVEFEIESSDTSIQCTTCGQEFERQDELNEHMSTDHKLRDDLSLVSINESQKYFQVARSTLIECTFCHKQTKNVTGMKTHITRLHKDQSVEETDEIIERDDDDGQIREYVLKVKDSVDKKLKCGNLDPVKVLTVRTNGKEKANNETMTIQLNLGMFEYLIRHLGEELSKRKQIEVKADPKPPPKAPTDLFSDAIVECQGNAKFRVNGKDFSVKITMFNTGTCTMNIQSGGQKPLGLGGVTVAEFFAFNVVAPMVNDINDENPLLNDIAKERLNILSNQIRQYEVTSKSTNNKSTTSAAIECSNGVTNESLKIIPKCRICEANVVTESFGNCYKCGNVEHFNCTPGVKKNSNEYKTGKKKYTCEACCLGLKDSISGECYTQNVLDKVTPIEQNLLTITSEGPTEVDNEDANVTTATLEESVVEETVEDSHEIAKEIIHDVIDNRVEQSQVIMVNEEYITLEVETEQLKGKIESLEVAVNDHKNENNKLETEKEALKEEIENIKGKLNESITFATRTLTESEKTESDLKKQIEDVESDLDRLRNVAKKRFEQLTKNICDSNVQLLRHENKITELVKEKEAVNNENETHKMLYEELKEKVERIENSNLKISGTDEAVVEVVSDDNGDDLNEKENDDELEELLGLVRNNQRGFKRTSPASQSNLLQNQSQTKTNHRTTTTNGTNLTNAGSNNNKRGPESSTTVSKRYCHFYNNRGGCRPPSGQCEWLHEKAPRCNNDINNQCARVLCMFSHVNKSFQSVKENQGFQQVRQHRPGEQQRQWETSPTSSLPVFPWTQHPPPPMMNSSNFPPMMGNPWQKMGNPWQKNSQNHQGWWAV
jgi:hypothetical protein